MTTTDVIHDPLTINLRRLTGVLLSKVPSTSSSQSLLCNASTNIELLRTLSQLLISPPLTLIIAAIYRPLLVDLCARWLEDEDNMEEKLVALCLLVEVHEELYPILHRLLISPVFRDGPLTFVGSENLPLAVDTSRLHRLLLAYYRILQANREIPEYHIWPLSPLSTIIWSEHLDNASRLLAIRLYALQSGMGEAVREDLEKQIFGEICGPDCSLEYGQDVDGNLLQMDGWIMPATEVQRVRDARNEIVRDMYDYYGADEREPVSPISPFELSRFVANVHGVFLVRHDSPQQKTLSSLIPTSTAIKSLQTIAVHLSLRIPVLLTSPPSCGKSLFISHLAGLLFPNSKNQVITIHLADTSLDPRSLLGSYVSSSKRSGVFEWKEGVLVRSMREGKWVVFEDIDKGSNEVLGLIKPLVESMRLEKWIGGRASLQVPSRGRIVAHNNFAIFATRSVLPSRTGSFPSAAFFGSHKFYEVEIPAPTDFELRIILSSQFPRLAGSPILALIRLWEAVGSFGSAASTRQIGLRELEKFCQRVHRLLPSNYQPMDVDSGSSEPLSLAQLFPNPILREDMYAEARDVFFGTGAPTNAARAHMQTIATVIAEHLGLDPERCSWILSGRVSDLDYEKDANGNIFAVRIGRTRLASRAAKAEIVPPSTRPFAMHKPAVQLLSRIATAIALSEPVLLTGETGTGKTSAVTHLASLLRRPLISLNLSHQTESSDLLGGFKPIDAKVPASALQERFVDLFGGTFSRKKNEKFETEVRKAVTEGKWKRVVGLWKESCRLARERINASQKELRAEVTSADSEAPRKKRKVDGGLNISDDSWAAFLRDVEEFEVQHVQGKGKFAFGFVEGPLVRALRSGDWILLDEINLASAETLECISGLLHGPTASITLTEQGSLEPVPRHPDFRLFACMNPATDVGKKDLPPNIRSRFTEIDVPPPDADMETLLSIVNQYISPIAVGDKAAIMDVAEFYAAIRELAEKRQLADGSNHRPHYSMRTLARALTFASDTAGMLGLRRAIWEGCLMAFTMVLDPSSAEIVAALAHKYLLKGVRNPKSLLAKPLSTPRGRSPDEFIKIGPFYLERGPMPSDLVEDYIMTPSVETKLIDLARIILTRRFPVLIEGPTSSGKTSSVEYLAKRTGHRFVRINNHEHTDIQEYVGSYVSDPVTGKLVFKDGLLVSALRNGDWIVLDELNLAPTDVLEALNRLLDDNRELVIPETQEVVRPHSHFMLFATQNPPGLYAGRKVLSRAFRNRFLEVHFQDVPQSELETILCQRCKIAPSYGNKIVKVFHELQKRRQAGRVFESKHGFATLRDLFRWAGRDAIGYQELADNGYMLLAERTRRQDDKIAVKEVIESVMNVKIDENAIYDLRNPGIDYSNYLGCLLPSSSGLVWTKAMQRLFVLVSRALKYDEPVLLVGDTGSGKTSICQVFAETTGQHLHILNCHQNTETADIIGGLRPIRNRAMKEADILREFDDLFETLGIAERTTTALHNKVTKALKSSQDLDLALKIRLEVAQLKLSRGQAIFEWQDGPLVDSMRNGDVFLLDEISLADDSVLERLNSVLEPSRSIVLAERGGDVIDHSTVRAADNFKLVATMNPGGDYGKKELSPALRNRFTEIWVPRVDERNDLELIIASSWIHEDLKVYTNRILDFVEWLCSEVGDRSLLSLRDILAWVNFSNAVYQPDHHDCIPAYEIFFHAAHMTFLDGLASLSQLSSYSRQEITKLRNDAMLKLRSLVPEVHDKPMFSYVPAHDPTTTIQFGPFAIPKGSRQPAVYSFNLQAPTTLENAMRVIRACQVPKPILLEGSPGVGKTSLVAALANISGHQLCRINLSDQTDLIDLFGSDLPVEGGDPGEFAWKDAEFLRAMQEGYWVLLDEMNLAPQAILEGLNAVLDHRGTVFIPELGRTFTRHPSFRIFAAQNPLNQGGGRKGLPKSFLDRFTKVYVEELSPSDLLLVCQQIFPDFDDATLRAMIAFNTHLQEEIVISRRFAREGSPWEFNLRDVIRWGRLVGAATSSCRPVDYLSAVYLHRLRAESDRIQARAIFDRIFSTMPSSLDDTISVTVSPTHLRIGRFVFSRENMIPSLRSGRLLKMHLGVLESIGHCISQSWLAILTGPRGCGKTSAVRLLSQLTGNRLEEIPISSSTDTMDILGSFEQVDLLAKVEAMINDILGLVRFELQASSRSAALADIQLLQKSRGSSSPNELLQLASRILRKLTVKDVSSIHQNVEKLLVVAEGVGRFEWVDGPLVRAMKKGDWILLDGANLCNSSVLDRLNSLCEPDGILALSERGFVDGKVEILKPHPNFRLFMTVDPQHGELSRAMRNRGIEIAFSEQPISDDPSIIADFKRLPILPIHLETTMKSHLDFDLLRRGLHRCVVDCPPNVLSSLGHVLDHHADLSALFDKTPVGLLLNEASREYSDDTIFFSARIIILHFLPQLQKFIQPLSLDYHQLRRMHNLLDYLSSSALRTSLPRFHAMYSLMCMFPGDLISYQPVDFYLQSPPCPDRKLEREMASTHQELLQAIDLTVLLFLDEERLQRQPLSPKRDSLPSEEENIRELCRSIISSTNNTARKILESLSTKDLSAASAVKLVIKLLKYTPYLHQAIAASSIDLSMVHAVSRWILDVADGCLVLGGIPDQSRALHDLTSPTTGEGLMEIWELFFIERPLSSLQDLQNIDDLARSLRRKDSLDLRRRTFDLMATKTLPSSLPGDATATLATIRSQLENHVSCPSVQKEVSNALRQFLLASELSLLTKINDHKDFDRIWKTMLNVLCLSNASLRRYICYQHLSWSLEAGQNPANVVIQVWSEWLNALWSFPQQTDDPTTQLLCPTQLSAILSMGVSHTSLAAFEDHEAYLNHLFQLTASQSDCDAPRSVQLAQLVHYFLILVSYSFAASYEVATYGIIRQYRYDPRLGLRTSILRLLELISQSRKPALHRAVRNAIHYLSQRLSGSETNAYSDLGLCWTAMGNLVLGLYIPDTPLDPAAIRNLTSQRLRLSQESLQIQIGQHISLERLISGKSTNELVEYLSQSLDQVSQEISRTRVLPVRQSVATSRTFWAEIAQFRSQIIAPSKIDGLVELLQRGEDGSSLREEVTQQSMAGFSQRLESIYPEYADLSRPIQFGMLCLRTGLRMMSRATADRSGKFEGDTNRAIAALIAFPSAAGAITFCHASPSKLPSLPAFGPLLLTLSALTFMKSIGIKKTFIDTLDVTYEQSLRLWLIDRTKEDDRDRDSRSLYKAKDLDHTDLSDAEIQEQEFLSIFPTFDDVLDLRAPSGVEKPNLTLLVTNEDADKLVDLHRNLFGSFEATREDQNLVASFNDARTAVLRPILQTHLLSFPDSLDRESLHIQLSLLYGQQSFMRGISSISTIGYDFYANSNVPEVKKAALAVTALKVRIDELIEMWPEQMILHHIKTRCEGLLQLDLASPVAKVLSAVEQLLLHMEDWEMYSNRHNSLKAHQQILTGLVVEWRRLELSCWQGLLESQARSFEKAAYHWWFKLYDVTVRGSLNASEDSTSSDSVTGYLGTLVPLLDDFIKSGPLGQFFVRMDLLRSFADYLDCLASSKSGHAKITLSRVKEVIHSTWLQYDVYSKDLADRLRKERTALEKETLGFIKLASWKDINVQALKQSAQKTHRQLYKTIRKFREILREPIVQYIVPQFSYALEPEFSHPSSPNLLTPRSIVEDSGKSSSTHLASLERTHARYMSFIAARIEPFIHATTADTVDDFAASVISTARELGSAAPPSGLSKEKRDKYLKALHVRKRKAWADFLKELKRLGYAVNVPSEVLRRQADILWLREQPVLPKIAEFETPQRTLEGYFVRLRKCLPELRLSLPNHHSDLTTRDLQRGLSLLESGFSMSVDLRTGLCHASAVFLELRNLLQRLEEISTTTKRVIMIRSLRESMCTLSDVLSLLSCSLQEAQDALRIHDEGPMQNGNFRALQTDVASFLGTTKGLQEDLSKIVEKVSSCSLPVVLEDENRIILNVLEHFTKTHTELRDWLQNWPAAGYIIHPISEWLASQTIPSLVASDLSPSSALDVSDNLINVFLVTVQNLMSRCPDADALTSAEETVPDNHISTGYRAVRDLTLLMDLKIVKTSLNGALAQLVQSSHLQDHLKRVLPFLEIYMEMARDQLASHVEWTKALFKLNFVLCSILHSLSTRGFCRPPESDEAEAAGNATETIEGTGLGEGSGVENVSKEIEDESQVEGLKGEKPDEERSPDDDQDDDAVEMDDDVGGDLQDVPDNDSQEGDDDRKSDGEPDETLGKLDASDPSAVDEKLWGDEKGPESDEADDKIDQDRSKEQSGEAELVAKEENQNQPGKSEKREAETKSADEPPPTNEDAEGMNERDDNEDEANPEVSGAPMQDYTQDAETLDLPDDIDFGGDEGDTGDKDMADDLEMSEDEEAPMDDAMEESVPEPIQEPSQEDVAFDAHDSPQGRDDLESKEEEQQNQPTRESENEDTESQQGDVEPQFSRPDIASGQSDLLGDALEKLESGDNASAAQQGTFSGSKGEEATQQVESDRMDHVPNSVETQAEPHAHDSQAPGAATSGVQQGPSASQTQEEFRSNPLRSLGDALKEIQQRFDEILSRSEEEIKHERVGNAGESSQIEYLLPEETDQEMQALAPSGEEEAAKLKDLNMVTESDEATELGPMDVDQPYEEEHASPSREPRRDARDQTSTQERGNVEGALLGESRQHAEHAAAIADLRGPKAEAEMEEDLGQTVETQLRTWQTQGFPEAGAERMWRQYESLTHDLAYTLCEQLRLILEPTLATRLKGDYRTGKRLNMKKIIPYIASDYTKDKIWLRRTRPSQREYQILVAIDDSRSMAESHSIHLAYETLALVSKALSRLEAGEVAVVKFGETVDVLHNFSDGPFTDLSGTKVMSSFRFNQKATNVLSLVNTSLKVLETARESRSMTSASVADLWQLEIIISDGMCQDHDLLRTVLRKAEEQRVMVVFIILDSLHALAAHSSQMPQSGPSQSSILSMDRAEFKNVDGRMELQLRKYLDTFPFEYYMVLRNVEALPDVLSSTLKQFFERISEE